MDRASKTRAVALKHNLDGYADWAYNSWPKDIYKYPVFNFTQGDEYYVYPGKEGPISSIRWELIKEGIEDFKLAKIQQKNGSLSSEQVKKALELATRNAFYGEKDPNDLVKARQILLQREKLKPLAHKIIISDHFQILLITLFRL